MEPIEKGQDYLLIGIGARNTKVDIGKLRYDPSYIGFSPAK